MSFKSVFLITGASGFVGACLLRRLLAEGQEVHALLRPGHKGWRLDDVRGRFHEHASDLSDPDELTRLVQKICPTVIYHLAAYGAYPSQNDAALAVQTNITGTWNLLRATADIDYELFVNTGSSSEYGFKTAPMKETDRLDPASHYAVTKSSQTQLCSYVAKAQGKPVVTLRPFSVYGPYEEPTRFVPTLMMSLARDKEMNLVDPKIARDWIYVDDVVDAYRSIDRLKACSGEVFNIGTGAQTTIQGMVEAAVEVSGKTPRLKWGGMANRAWDTNCWVADIAKAKARLAWGPRIDVRQGLALTWDWINRHQHLYS